MNNRELNPKPKYHLRSVDANDDDQRSDDINSQSPEPASLYHVIKKILFKK